MDIQELQDRANKLKYAQQVFLWNLFVQYKRDPDSKRYGRLGKIYLNTKHIYPIHAFLNEGEDFWRIFNFAQKSTYKADGDFYWIHYDKNGNPEYLQTFSQYILDGTIPEITSNIKQWIEENPEYFKTPLEYAEQFKLYDCEDICRMSIERRVNIWNEYLSYLSNIYKRKNKLGHIYPNTDEYLQSIVMDSMDKNYTLKNRICKIKNSSWSAKDKYFMYLYPNIFTGEKEALATINNNILLDFINYIRICNEFLDA